MLPPSHTSWRLYIEVPWLILPLLLGVGPRLIAIVAFRFRVGLYVLLTGLVLPICRLLLLISQCILEKFVIF